MNDTGLSLDPNPIHLDLDLPAIKLELLQKSLECQQRGLSHSHKWLAEINYALRSVSLPSELAAKATLGGTPNEHDFDLYLMAKSYFDVKEYDRCAHFTANSDSSKLQFLHLYARYLSGEKKKLEDMTDAVSTPEKLRLKHLRDLREEMEKLHNEEKLDGYCLYLYGIVLKKLSLNSMARDVISEAVRQEPCHWGAWLELSGHITDRNEIEHLDLPEHWMKHFFLAHTYLELQLNEDALGIYFGLQARGLQDSTYILAQIAIIFHNMRQVDQAVEYFLKVTTTDPCRLDNLDTYSNLLYVKEHRVDLAHLAHRVAQIDKYRPETCCIIGNYYSLRSQHDKAVTYFQRALKLNPNYLSAWTLMGHEFIELKNITAAIQCYRHGIEVSKRDYRAWYGLGQTYELLKMYYYCLYYYKKAQELRPTDSRMLVALGGAYEKLEKFQDAKKCFWKAHCVGDIEGGIALLHLAKLFERTSDTEQAAAAYFQYIQDSEQQGIGERDQQGLAFKFLAQYFLDKDQLEDAFEYAQKCTEFADTKEDGKSMLKEITNKRAQRGEVHPGGVMVFSSTSGNTTDQPTRPFPRTSRDLEPMNLTFTP
ncbi:cell division cycle protein 23 homolog [Tigriopus californicus]|uniref:cell division cycle protein 23 homolog n=1 Tax=Tigriopus californicus TaxID=6832 RepID=UPI0027D9FBDA|nr:cell division cycle protein 23 homolog [Tigriopus californicus]